MPELIAVIAGLAIHQDIQSAERERQMKKWQCVVCGFIYDEAEGWPDDGIAPGTAWQDVPEDWLCPDCGVGKEDFEMVEI